MVTSDHDQESLPHRGSSFATTQWTLVLDAGDQQSPGAHEALATLCEIYWYPLYVYLRRRGYPREEAEDLVQGFFTQVLEKGYMKAANRDRGRFRSFLLTSLKNFATNEWDRKTAKKRGGNKSVLSLDFDTAEGRYRVEPADNLTPEVIFDRRWALIQLGRAMARLDEEMAEAGNSERFDRLKGYLTGDSQGVRYAQVAENLEISESAVKVAVHRMRRRFGELLREEIARTVSTDDHVDEEIRYLLSSISANPAV